VLFEANDTSYSKKVSEGTNRDLPAITRRYNFQPCTPTREPRCTALQTDSQTDSRLDDVVNSRSIDHKLCI